MLAIFDPLDALSFYNVNAMHLNDPSKSLIETRLTVLSPRLDNQRRDPPSARCDGPLLIDLLRDYSRELRCSPFSVIRFTSDADFELPGDTSSRRILNEKCHRWRPLTAFGGSWKWVPYYLPHLSVVQCSFDVMWTEVRRNYAHAVTGPAPRTLWEASRPR